MALERLLDYLQTDMMSIDLSRGTVEIAFLWD